MSIDQYKIDVREGDIGTAKRRLASYIACTEYDSNLCSTIGDLCLQMKDPMEAARWYLIGSETTEKIESCIDRYFHATREHPNTIIAKIPGKARLANSTDYPPVVQDRLRRISIDNRDTYGNLFKSEQTRLWSPSKRLMTVIVFAVIYGGLGLIIIGLVTVVGWILGLL